MDEKKKIKLMLVIGAIALPIIIIFNTMDYLSERSYEFNGVASNVNYSDKGDPLVVIDKKKYVLSNNLWSFEHKIQSGDSLIKKKGEMVIKLIRHKTGQIIIFN